MHKVDWALCSTKLLTENVSSFKINNELTLPTDHAAISLELDNLPIDLSRLRESSEYLGQSHTAKEQRQPRIRKPIRSEHINKESFAQNLPTGTEFWSNLPDDNLKTLCEKIANVIYETSKKSQKKQCTTNAETTYDNRWNNLLRNGDDKQLWAAVNWNGSLQAPKPDDKTPSDKEFCTHFEELLKQPNNDDENAFQPSQHIYIPLLDDPIQPIEVAETIRKLKSSKAAGIDGITPGILKLLPEEWIIQLTQIFNMTFFSEYPLKWSLLKVFTIFKKGQRSKAQNYRGISILSAIPKVYDMILSRRFKMWYTPKPEQAGAQPKRGCSEQILTLRLLIDMARKKKKELYIAYVDYQKAYDKVNRKKLLEYLESKGCGTTFLLALRNSMKSTGIIGQESFGTSAGVKQGGGTSCQTFTGFIDPTIDAVNAFGEDDWLEDLHTMLLMDDTVILATSRKNLAAKLRLLKNSTDEIGMLFHPTKCQFMTVNSEDKEAIQVDDIKVGYTSKYTYLGAVISNQSITEQLKDHIKAKQPHVRKFTSFLTKNANCPYKVKIKVMMDKRPQRCTPLLL